MYRLQRSNMETFLMGSDPGLCIIFPTKGCQHNLFLVKYRQSSVNYTQYTLLINSILTN